MKARGSRCHNMPCESCAVQFSVFRRKRACCECERYYCSGCLRRGGGVMCSACRVLSTRPLSRQTIAHLKVRDLQCFLQRQNVSTRGCVEKEELLSLCVSHVNSAAYRRRGPRAAAGPFSTLKDFTKLINNAFDIRPPAQPAPAPPSHSNCYNSAHVHSPTAQPAPAPARERFTTTPGGERDIVVPVPAPADVSRSTSGSSAARVDTADCFEIEDLDDAGWEFVTRPADPLPNDSDVLIAENENPPPVQVQQPIVEETPAQDGGGAWAAGGARGGAVRLGVARLGGTPQRAASELELRREAAPDSDSASLQDESLMDQPTQLKEPESTGRPTLEQMKSASELEALSVKQLKELLARNRVAYRGCLERADLLARAQLLWRDHAAYRDEIDNLPLEECCKICMCAPLECVLLECGHIAACTRCAAQLAECPICRQYVVRAVRFFRS